MGDTNGAACRHVDGAVTHNEAWEQEEEEDTVPEQAAGDSTDNTLDTAGDTTSTAVDVDGGVVDGGVGDGVVADVAAVVDDDERRLAAEADNLEHADAGGDGGSTDGGAAVAAEAVAAATTSSTSRRSRLRASAADSPWRCCWGSRSRDRLKPGSEAATTASSRSTRSPETRPATLSGRPSTPPESLSTLSGEQGAEEAESLDDRHDSPLLVAT